MAKRILSQIWIYPIKSLGGIQVSSSQVREKGLLYDRRWMLVDENNIFMTQRICNEMALFKLSFKNDGFEIKFKEDTIYLPFAQPYSDEPVETNVWDDKITAFEVIGEYSAWFSTRLNKKCRLVFFPEQSARPVDKKYAVGNEHVSLADGYPLLIIGQASLDDLNGRLDSPVPMNRFRPNLVFTGGEPYEEDSWHHFEISNNRFYGVKPCARCVLTTVDQDTAIKGKEPLATMAKYRTREGKVYFGQNVLSVDHKEIHEGDEIIIS